MADRKFTDEQELVVAQEYLSGISARELGRKYSTKHNTICSALRRTGTKQRSPSERNRLYQVDKHAFDVIDNEEKAYWWGFLYADGTVNREKSVIVSLSRKDISHLYKLKEFLKSEHPVNETVNTIKNKVYLSCKFSATERHLAKRLLDLGVVPFRGHFDKVINNLPAKFYRHWIRGFSDGDAGISIGKDRQPCIKFCGRKEELLWMREIFNSEIGFNKNISVTPHTFANAFYLSYAGRIQLLKLRDYFYRDAEIYLDRKRNTFMSISDKSPPERMRNEKGQFI